jgi:cytidylate kinase
MHTITISRQLGSLGDEVAKKVAERLGYQVVCREIINQAAIQCGAPELALAWIDDLGILNIKPTPKERLAFLSAIQEAMDRLAEQGNVIIVGRAGQVILGNRSDVLHVKVIAPVTLRAKRIAHWQNISITAALTQVETSDSTRRNYLKRYYRARWDDPELYDLIINTARVNPDQGASMICRAVELSQPITSLNAARFG